MSRARSRNLGLGLVACAALLTGMDVLEWRQTGRLWTTATALIPVFALLGPWWIVVGRPADPGTGRVPAWIVRGEVAITVGGLAVGVAALVW
jgi:hypothetical protein